MRVRGFEVETWEMRSGADSRFNVWGFGFTVAGLGDRGWG